MSTNLATFPTQESSHDVSTSAMVFDPAIIDGMQRMAVMMSEARVTIPKHLQGSPADCLAVIMMAAQHRINPYVLAQKTFLVSGVIGYEAQLVQALIANSGAVRGRFHYEYRGEGQGVECRVGAVPAGESNVVWGEWLSASSVTTKNSPLWKTNPKQQLGYLQVKNWARQYVPGAILGVYSDDELQDHAIERPMGPAEVVPMPPAANRTDTLKAQLAARKAASEPVAPVPDLPLVLTLIRDAGTAEALHGAVEMAKRLASDADKAEARKQFKARQAEMKKAADADPVPDLTLAPTDEASAAMDSVRRALASSKTQEDIDECLDFVRSLPLTEAHKQELDKLVDEAMRRIG